MAPNKTGAGDLRERVTFQQRGTASDGAGGTVTTFTDQFTVSAQFVHLRGGESVMAARLEGVHTQVIRVRRSSDTRKAGHDWRIVDARAGTEFNIRDITPTDDRAFLDFLVDTAP